MKKVKFKILTIFGILILMLIGLESVAYAACASCTAGQHGGCTGTVTFKYQNESCDWVYCCDGQKALYYANHDWGAPYTITKYATCTATGTKTSKACSRCGRSKTQSYGPLGHDMGSWYISKNETCTEDGQNKRDCKRSGCNYSETSVRPKLGHNWSTAWSYDDSATGNHWHKCTRCSATTDVGQHSDTNKYGYCNTCGYRMYILIKKPTIEVSSFVYNGHAQSPTFNNFNSSYMTISGNSQIHVGNYTATISLKSNNPPYRWSEDYKANGGGTSALTFSWKITVKHVVATWGDAKTFECDKTKTQIPSVVIASGVDVDTINSTPYTAQTWVGDYIAYCKIDSVTGVGNTTDYQLDPNPSSTAFKIVDTTPPTITVTPSHTTWTNQNVTFTISSDDSGQGVHHEYSTDRVTWRNDLDGGTNKTSGTKTFTTDQDNLIWFRAIDNCDNISATAGPYVIKIDKTAPTFTTTKDPDKDWTNQNVLLTIFANDNMGVTTIKVNNTAIPDADIKNYGVENDRITGKEGRKTITQNGTYSIEVADVAGNKATGSVTVTNIDKIKPTITFNASIDTNEQTIVAKDDVSPNSKMRYIAVCTTNTQPKVFGDGSATEGTLYNYYYQVANNASISFKFTFSSEGTYYIFARDLAGNYETFTTTLTYPSIEEEDVEITLEYEGGTPNGYIYDGLPHVPKITLKDKTKSNKILVEGVDYTKTVSNNIDYGTASIVFTGIGNYKGTITKTFNILKRDLNIIPDSGQSKLTLVDDPIFTYTYNNVVPGEVPKFSGQLSRDAGENVGEYNITLGTLQHVNNLSTGFKEKNYKIVFTPNVKFTISDFDSLITTWKVPAGGTIRLPIPSYADNDYIVSWGDGKMDKITQAAFPSHTYTNTSQKNYVIRVSGKVNTVGYVNDVKPEAGNIYNPYVTFNQYLVAINSFGNVNAKRIGFSFCTNLAGTIPARSGFDNLVSVENMFNECVNLVGPVPSNFYSNITTIESARKVFNNCKKLTGSLDATVFANCTGIKSFNNAFKGCVAMTGSIPENMFATNINVTNFAGVFSNMTRITGEIPEKLFEKNTKVQDFSEAFELDAGLTKLPEKLFDTNKLATNYYHTFYKCTKIPSVPTKLFTNNVVGKISNASTCYRDYRGTFEGCTGLTYLDIDCLYIGKDMFKNCNKIEKIVIPNVIELGDGAFYGCNKLTHIKISKDNYAKAGNDTFEYTGANPPLLTYINTDNQLLYEYVWLDDNRTLDYTAPRGTVEIVAGKYPFTKTESIRLNITVTDDISSPENCLISILNDADLKDYTPEQIQNYRIADRAAIDEAIANVSVQPDSLFTICTWENFAANKNWTLTPGEGVKTVYVYFMDEMGNISFVSQDLELEK